MRLEAALAAVRAVRDCPAVARLCLDCWLHAAARGEEEGLAWAAMLLDGVTAYQRHEELIRRPLSPRPPDGG